jgi:exopolysaccharide transport family protein
MQGPAPDRQFYAGGASKWGKMHGRISPQIVSPQLVSQTAPAEPSDAIDLRHVQDFFWRRWKLIAVTAAVLTGLTFTYLLTITPRYTTSAQILLEPRKDKAAGAESIVSELSLESENIESQISVIRSTNLLRRVVEKNNLTADAKLSQPRSGMFGFVTGLFRSAPTVEAKPTGPNGIPPDVLDAIESLRGSLGVQRETRSYVISISVTSEDPIKAARLANAVADAYVVDQLDARYEGAKRASAWLADRIVILRDQVRQSEEAVAKFRREHNLQTTTSDAKVTITDQQLAELNAKLVSARAETAERRAKYEQAKNVTAEGGNLQSVPDVVRSPVIAQLRNQQAQLGQRVAELSSRYTSGHPLVVDARAQLRDVERSISAEVERIIANLKNDFEVAQARQTSLEQSLKELSGETGNDTEVGITLRELERTNAANKALFENFLSRAKISEQQLNFEQGEARIITPAERPESPSYPRKRLILSLALVVGCLIGIAGGVALDMLNSGFTSGQEIEDKLGIAVLASVPLLRENERNVDGNILDPARYIAVKPLSRYAESVRSLRMGVQMSDVDSPAKVVLVTSAVPNEGKSVLVRSLAYSAHKAGLRTVIVDADLRHPSVSRFFGLDGKSGLVEFLTGTAGLEQVLVSRDGIAVLAAGTAKSQNPPDLLGSARMHDLVEQLRNACDYIIIDSPPVGPVIDAKIAVQLADKVIFAVRWQSTAREIVSRSVESLAAQGKLAGIALTMVDEMKTPRYGPYSHLSGNYYGKYYQN